MNFPIIRLELENMKQTLMVALTDYHLQMTGAVDAEMERAISQFDFESAVGHATTEAISEVINDYFKYGNGRQIIRQAIQETFDAMFTEKTE